MRRGLQLTVTVLAAAFLIWIASPATIIPPSNPATPVTVFVIDQGFHSRLVLPKPLARLIQYAYGDWYFFALNQQGWLDAARALFVPSPGTLGRRQYENENDLRQTVERNRGKLLEFQVAQAKASQLLNQLNDRFNRNINSQIENPRMGMTFVQEDVYYTVFHNSNHEVVNWLRDLDCRVNGFVIWANFRVRTPAK